MMPTVYRNATFVACAVLLTASIQGARAEGLLATGPTNEEEVLAKQKAWVTSIVKRRNYASEEQLREQLHSVPDVGLDRKSAEELIKTLGSKTSATATKNSILLDNPSSADVGIQTLKNLASSLARPELAALPWQPTDAQQLNLSLARSLQDTSTILHARLMRLPQGNKEITDLDTLRTKLWGPTTDKKWDQPDCIPAMTQILQAKPKLMRKLLVERLASIPGSASSEALAQRAIYDLSPEIRDQALAALQSRPVHEYKKTLLNGLRWPWRPVTEHAAEAIAKLQLKTMAQQLTAMLQEPDPAFPYVKDENGAQVMYLKEVVKMNHSQNCLLCHPPSFQQSDLVRGKVPSPGEIMTTPYGQSRSFHGATVMVRADNTTLRQEFSILQSEGRPTGEPTQRYDYFLRERRATAAEVRLHFEREKGLRPRGPNVEREALLYALNSIGK